MRSILVTGGSGFFGRGFVRAALSQGIERICVFSRGEYQQALMRKEFDDDARIRWFIGDVRSQQRLEDAMEGVDTVVHAAALKRIEVGYYNPDEMFETNLQGTRNVIHAAKRAGVCRVVGLSSDKAFEPASAYGISKAAAECLMLAANATRGSKGPIYSCVRYGNVWNSTGSIVPAWKSLVEMGYTKLPVTDPDCTRFFMRREEAVELVMCAIREMKGGELYIPSLPAFRVEDLVEAFDCRMEVIGLAPFEKLHESMKSGNSSDKARRMSVDELRGELSAV